MKRRIVFAPRTFDNDFSHGPHPLDEVFEMLLNGHRYAVIALLQDRFPECELDEYRLRREIESDLTNEYDVEPPLRLVTRFAQTDLGCQAITDFVLD